MNATGAPEEQKIVTMNKSVDTFDDDWLLNGRTDRKRKGQNGTECGGISNSKTRFGSSKWPMGGEPALTPPRNNISKGASSKKWLEETEETSFESRIKNINRFSRQPISICSILLLPFRLRFSLLAVCRLPLGLPMASGFSYWNEFGSIRNENVEFSNIRIHPSTHLSSGTQPSWLMYQMAKWRISPWRWRCNMFASWLIWLSLRWLALIVSGDYPNATRSPL